MTGCLSQSSCPPVSAAPWTIRIPDVVTAIGIATLVASLIASAGRHDAVPTARSARAVFSRLSGIPSHNGAYRASLVRSMPTARSFSSATWTVDVRTANDTPVEGATLALERWMPDDSLVLATHPRVTANLGGGRYRIEGLVLDRRGWWNVKLQISAATGTDSLAFNLVR
ncbi:MAG TPA: FixH family protein [Gemmatimonadaceae bacterium]|nr:FixH family protein [Gemmatimonadaceae bacterium]